VNRRFSFALALALFLVAIGPRWLPWVGIDPQAAVNVTILIGLAVTMVRYLTPRFIRF
jgi:hypothetical protein